MSPHTIRDVVIVGGGTAGWMTAAALSRFLNNGVTRITLVESEEIGTVGVGEATIPPLANFNAMLGINENDFLAATGGTFKLGIEFVNWGGLGERYFHPFGRFGQPLQGIHFHQLYLRERTRRVLPDISAWSMGAVAAAMGKFGRAAAGARSPVREMVYAFHLDATLYAALLRRYSEQSGVRRVEGRVVGTDRDAETGHVRTVRLAGGQRVDGELFIDCSGFRGLLIEEALGTGYEDWKRWLPCDRAIAVPTATAGDPPPFTRATAHGAGWQWRIPLQHRVGNGLVYDHDHLADDDAERLLLANLGSEPTADPRRLRFVTGRRKLCWNRNVVALGLSSGFIEPLESTSIHLIQSGISRLIALFPDARFTPIERDEYNRQMIDLYDDVRDFVILHYKATRRNDTPFWNHCRTMPIPDTLRHRMELFAGKGRVFREGAELFSDPSWIAVCMGQHVIPSSYEPPVDGLDEDKVAEALDQMRRGYLETARGLPTHAEFLRQAMASVAAAHSPPPPATDEELPFFSFSAASPFDSTERSPV